MIIFIVVIVFEPGLGIKQFYVNVEKEEWKLETLCDLYAEISVCQAIIYCNLRRKVLQEAILVLVVVVFLSLFRFPLDFISISINYLI